MKRLLVGLLALLAARSAAAREYDTEIRVSSAEDLYELQYGGDLEAEDVDILIALFERPLDINRADRELLYDLPGVSYGLADAIVAERAARAAFTLAADLLTVPGMTPTIFEQLEPFVTVTAIDRPGEDDGLGVRAKAELGVLWLDGLVGPWDGDRTAADIDLDAERLVGPQAFLSFEATGLTYYGLGGLLTFRSVTPFELQSGLPVSPGTENRPRFDKLYAFANFDRVSAIVGSYNVGFGERLTFNTVRGDDPDGWREESRVRRDRDDGKLSPLASLFGAAVMVNDLQLGPTWVDVTAFGSRRKLDVYQYSGDVTTDIGSIDGDDPPRFATIEDLVLETLGGGNVTLNVNEDAHVGVTGYAARAEAQVPSDGFGLSSIWPNEDYGAVGVNGRWRLFPIDLRAEYTRTFANGGADGAYLRGIWDLQGRGEVTLSLRYYSHLFQNPSANPRAARDEAFGLTARNERGLRAQAQIHATSWLRSVTVIDTWQNPYQGEDVGDRIEWTRRDEALQDLLVSQRLVFAPTYLEDFTLFVEYADKDLDEGGREQVYAGTDTSCDSDAPSANESECGRGARFKWQVSAVTERIPATRLQLTFQHIFEDGATDDSFDTERTVRGRVTVRPFEGTSVTAYASYYMGRVIDGADPIFDRAKPKLTSYVALDQRLGWADVEALYAMYHYDDDALDRYVDYQLFMLTLSGRY